LPANNSGLSSAPAAVFNTPCWNSRNVLGWTDAEHGETSPDAPRAVLTPLTCSLVEAIDSIHLVEGSLIAKAYETSEIREGYRCRLRCESAVRTSIADP
jgi:CTP synthase (UTP-ammonia lyase)